MSEPIIIGGGPAGAAAAIRLADAGIFARVLERKSAPHHKVCGEFISWEAAACLAQLGIDLPGLGARPVNHLRLYSGQGEQTASLPGTAWSLSRQRLDAALLARAEAVGVVVERGVTVKRLTPVAEGWRITTGGARREDRISGSVFLASGKHDLHQWRRRRDGHELVGLKMHLHLSQAQQHKLRETVEVHLFNGGYAGLELVEEGTGNLCLLMGKSLFHECDKQWARVVAWLGDQSPPLRQRLTNATACWAQPLAVYGTPYGYLHRPEQTQPGLFRLGDQTAVIPSFAGDGISIALHSALLAADTYSAGGTSRDYQQQAFAHFRHPVQNARLLESILSHSAGRASAFWLAKRWPAILNSAIVRTRLRA